MRRLPFSAVPKILGVLFFLAASARPLHADDGPFTVTGPEVSPSDNTSVQLVSETIVLKRRHGEIHVQSDESFVSPGDDADVTMGFPAEIPPVPEYGKKSKTREKTVRNFTVTVDGQPAKARLKKTASPLKSAERPLEQAYVWPVHLSQGVTLQVRNTYHFKEPVYVLSGRYMTDYVRVIPCSLRLGRLWAGAPGPVDVTLDLGEKPKAGLLETRPRGAKDRKGVLHWTFTGDKIPSQVEAYVHSAYRDQISEPYLRHLIGLDRPGFRKQKALMKLDSMEKLVIRTRFHEPRDCVEHNITTIENMERYLVRDK